MTASFPALPISRVAAWVQGVLFGGILLASSGLVLAGTGGDPVLGYHVTPSELRIDAHLGLFSEDRVVARSALGPARAVTLTGGARRTFGTGMPGYCSGEWTLDDLGPVQAAWDCGRAGVLVEVNGGGRPLWLSPPDPTAFLAALENPGNTYDTMVPTPPWSGGFFALAVLPLLILAGVFALVFAKVKGMVYRVEGGQLLVPASFSTVRVKLAGGRAWKGPLGNGARVAGTAVPWVLYLGLFRGGGRWAHMAATNVKLGWWVLGDRNVYVSPADDLAFEAALRAEGVKIGPAGEP